MPHTRKRFWAWTLTLTAALLAVVWVGSMRCGASVSWKPRYWLGVNVGLFMFGSNKTTAPPSGPTIERWDNHGWHVQWWFGYERLGRSTISIWRAPLWPFVLLTGVPGVWMLVKTRTRTNPNACPACGYDRTGLPQSPTGPAPCPECGKGKDDDAMKG